MIIVDASVVLRWMWPDPLSDACWKLFERAARDGLAMAAPSLLFYEVVSGLTKAVHFGRVTPDEARRGLDQWSSFDIQIIEPNQALNQRAFDLTLQLKRGAAYDSFYLALAEFSNAEFWTADRRLYNVAHAAEIGWVNWIERAN